MITILEFEELAAQGFNRIPLVLESIADLETPLSLYLKLVGGEKNAFLLESVLGGERFGRYSIIGLPAKTLLRATESCTEVVTDGAVMEVHEGDPLAFIEAYQSRFKVALPTGLPRFCGGLAGYFGHDVWRYIRPGHPTQRKDNGIGVPDILLLQTEELAVIDNVAGRLHLIVYTDPGQDGAYAQSTRRLATLVDRMRYSVAAPVVRRSAGYAIVRDFDKPAYQVAVARAKERIASGELSHVQIGQRLSKRYDQDPLSLYRALRTLNPSPYMIYFDLGEFQIVCASPELLVRHDRGHVQQQVAVRPLSGTRERGATPEQDHANEVELRADPNGRLHHEALLAVAQADIGAICEPGKLKVTEALAVQRYITTMHLVSNVEGVLRPGLTNIDVLRATFPSGTVTGAPKTRAIAVFDELEPTPRGIYGGGCGYMSYSGDMDLAIAIRLGLVKNGTLHVHASAVIGANTQAPDGWVETEREARALLLASEMVEDGF